MRVLLLASRVPYPIDNGEDLRIFHLARLVARRHDVHLVAYGATGTLDAAVGFLESAQSPGTRPTRATGGWTVRRLRDAFRPEALFGFDPAVPAAVERAHARQRFDVLWIPAWEMIPYAAHVRGLPCLIDVMDDGVLELLREVRNAGSLGRAVVATKRLLVTYRFERRYFPGARVCCLVATRDAAVLRTVCPGARTVVVENGVDLEYFRPLEVPEEEGALVFEGNMGFGPSVDAIVHFCRRVFPRVLARVPEARLYVVGKDPTQEVRALAGPRVVVTGYVDDVRPYLARAAVFVCPMRKGAGIKNKLLQAWAMAKPVVATPLSCGGLDAEDGANMLVRSEPDGFADAVVALMRDRALRGRLGRAGRETVERRYSWEQKAREFEAALERAAQAG